jgi:FixJ family two-component response regulator
LICPRYGGRGFYRLNQSRVSANTINIAVVDDDDSFLRAIGRLLRAAGFEPVGYSSAEAFLADTSHASPDCAVLDIHLGGMSGLDLRRQLLAQGSTLPVIFVTAHDEPNIRDEAQRAGCAAYLRKPVPGKLLIEAITKAVKAIHH